jgi:hypothetical protein
MKRVRSLAAVLANKDRWAWTLPEEKMAISIS